MTEVAGRLFINDLFWTVQGEGRNAGERALFVRMAKCNLSCSWCDTEFDSVAPIGVQEFADFIETEPCRFAVMTGGEPLLNVRTPVVLSMLKVAGFRVACETNGTMPPPKGDKKFDWITCSPKAEANYKVHELLEPHVSEYKYVIDKGFDLKLLDRHNGASKALLYLSPEFTDMAANVATILDYIKERPHWKLSLQTHKWIGVK